MLRGDDGGDVEAVDLAAVHLADGLEGVALVAIRDVGELLGHAHVAVEGTEDLGDGAEEAEDLHQVLARQVAREVAHRDIECHGRRRRRVPSPLVLGHRRGASGVSRRAGRC